MDQDTLLFFDGHAAALPLYEAFEQWVLSAFDPVKIKVQKTQISFYQKHLFACVSFLPLRKAAERPSVYLTITFGLDHRIDSSRIAVATEPYPNRWTHHLMISSPNELDEELKGWIREAGAFSANKR